MKNILIYGTFTGLQVLASLFLTSYTARVLTIDEFGKFAIFQAYLGIMNVFIGIVFVNKVVIFVSEGNKKEAERGVNFILMYGLTTAVAIQFIIFLLFELELLEQLRQIGPGLMILPLISFFSMLNALNSAIFQQLRYAFLSSGVHFLIPLLTLAALVSVNYMGEVSITERILSMGIGFGCVSIFGLILIRRAYKFDVWYSSKQNAKVMMAYGVPLIPHLIGLSIIAAGDKLIIDAKYGAESLGNYFLAMQVAAVLFMGFEVINRATSPKLFDILAEKNSTLNKWLKKVYILFIFTYFATGFVFYFVSDYFVYLIGGEKFSIDFKLMIPLVLSVVLNGLSLPLQNILYFHSETHSISKITLATGIFGLVVFGILSDFSIMVAVWAIPLMTLLKVILTLRISLTLLRV